MTVLPSRSKRRTKCRSAICRRNEPPHRKPGGRTGYHGAVSESRVKPLHWTAHALHALLDRGIDRGIDRAEAEQTIAAPELSAIDAPWRAVLMRRYFDGRLGRQMLLRVVVEETPDERVVVTVYKTSQIAKYLKGTLP
jgi:hypothetical protein